MSGGNKVIFPAGTELEVTDDDNNKTVLTETPEPDDVELQIQDAIGDTSDFTSIKLYRVTNDGKPWLRDYTEIPEHLNQAVKNEFGPGNYYIIIQWMPKNGKTWRDRKHVRKAFSIFDTGKTDDKPTVNLNGSLDSDLERMKKLKDIISDSKNGSGNTELIMKTIETMNTNFMELFKILATNKNGDSGMKTVVEKLLDNSLRKSDEPVFKQATDLIAIIDKLSGKNTGTGGNDWIEIAKIAAPILLGLGKQPAQLGAGTTGPAALPAAGNTAENPIVKTLTDVVNAVNAMTVNIQSIDKRLKETETWIKEETEEPGNEEPENEIPIELHNKEKEDPNQVKQALIEQMKKATPEEKVAMLKNALLTYNEQQVRDWCFDMQLVKTEDEWVDYLNKAKEPAV